MKNQGSTALGTYNRTAFNFILLCLGQWEILGLGW